MTSNPEIALASSAEHSSKFATEWERLQSEYDNGKVSLEETNASANTYELTFRDIAFKD